MASLGLQESRTCLCFFPPKPSSQFHFSSSLLFIISTSNRNTSKLRSDSKEFIQQTPQTMPKKTSKVKKATQKTKQVSVSRKFVLAGRGRVINHPNVKEEIIRMTGYQEASEVKVVYLGTPGYESQTGYDLQAKGFEESGCAVQHVKLTQVKRSKELMEEVSTSLNEADVIAVSGGNTLYAMKQWKKLGVDVLLRDACDRGAVLCGGSAGAICWYEGGHSDSRDPSSLLHVNPDLSEEEKANWSYINVKGLGFLDGVCCPHHDSIQSNGVPRSADFDAMMRRQHFPVGICIDDQAALAIDGDTFQVLARDGTSKVTKKYIDVKGSMSEKYFLPDGTVYALRDLDQPASQQNI